MSTPHSVPDAPESAFSPAAMRAELRLVMLDRLSVKTLGMAEAVEEGGSKGPVDAFAKNASEVRLTMTHHEMFADVRRCPRFRRRKQHLERPCFFEGPEQFVL